MLSRQPLPKRQRLAIRLQRLVRMARVVLEIPDVVVAAARSLWNSVTLGFSRASRSPIASALPYDSRAWSGWPVVSRRFPLLLWVLAISLWNSVTLGFSRASRSWIASALPYDSSAWSG